MTAVPPSPAHPPAPTPAAAGGARRRSRPDERTPVLVGVGQATQRLDDPAAADEPVDLLARAAAAAADDSGVGRALLDHLDTVVVAELICWRYPDPGALLARRLGLGPVRTVVTTVGGNSPQMALGRAAAAIAAGACDVVLLGGVECMHTRWRARRVEPKVHLAWTHAEDPPCPEVWGDARPGTNGYEMAHMALAPVHIYPLFETARRGAAGRDATTHAVVISELWARFAAVAAENPYAWSQVPWTAEEIRTPGPDNRLVAAPYTKRMCANLGVDQAAAVLCCSYGTARAAGVPDDRLVFPLASAEAHDHWWFSERWSLASSPAIAFAGRAALAAAGRDVDDVARFDLYSCFPSAVQLAADALGLALDDPRPFTVTGGLAFAGGPGNNYSTHAIARMVEACRADPGSVGLVSALGWYATKHAVGLYATTPPDGGFRLVDDLQARVDALPRRRVAAGYAGEATIEATTVVVDRDGAPTHAILAALTPDGRRALATSTDADVAGAMIDEAWEGRVVQLRPDGDTNRLDPVGVRAP